MRRLHLFLIAILASACGWSSSPTGPSPQPAEAVTFLVLTPTQPPAGELIGRFEDELGPLADLARALTAPGAPTSLAASVSGDIVLLTWTAPTSGDAPTTYLIEAGSSAGASNLANFATNSTATSFTARAPNGTFFVRVRAVNSCGTSGASNEITFTTPQVRLLLVALNPVLGAAIPGALYPQALQARVTDSRGNPIPNQRVTWSAGGENGWVFPATSLSGANGAAETRWIAGAAAALVVTAAVTDATGTLTARWSATRNVPAGPPGNNSANLGIVSPTATRYRVNLMPLTEPSSTYYAALNWDGGYAGLQRGGDLFDRQIHFACWDRNNVQTFVVDPAASRCDRFGGEGTGVKCRFSYPWTVGGTYEFEIRAAVGSATTEVSAWFTDLATNTRIKVPPFDSPAG